MKKCRNLDVNIHIISMINRKTAIAVIILLVPVLVVPAQTIWDSLAFERDSLHDLEIDKLRREQNTLKRDLEMVRSEHEHLFDSLFMLNETIDAELDILRIGRSCAKRCRRRGE